jgi:hypothetical protein
MVAAIERGGFMIKFISIILAFVGLFLISNLSAECTCECVNGHQEALCTSSLDLQPICPPRICPIEPPAVQPIEPPRVPPVGTTNCHQKQVWNPETMKYEWQEVCY